MDNKIQNVDKNDSTNNFSFKNNVDKNIKSDIDSKNKMISNLNYYQKQKNIIIIQKNIFLICIYKVEVFEIDLNNYLDNIYGEEDLLKIIKEKEEERDMLFTCKERKKEIEKQIKNIYNAIEQIKIKKKEIISNIEK